MPHCRKIACCGQCFAYQGSDAGHEVRPAMRHKADATNGSCCPPVCRRSQPGEDIGLHLANFPCIHGRNATHGADPGPQWTRGTTSGQPPESGADGADEGAGHVCAFGQFSPSRSSSGHVIRRTITNGLSNHLATIINGLSRQRINPYRKNPLRHPKPNQTGITNPRAITGLRTVMRLIRTPIRPDMCAG